MSGNGESDSSLSDLLTFDSTASIRLGQDDPPLQPPRQDRVVLQLTEASDEGDESCEEVDEPEQRSRFNPSIDKSLLAEVLATHPFAVERKAVIGVWKGIASRLNTSLKTNFSIRAGRDRISLLLRKYVVRKKRNEAASGTSEVHTDLDDVLEQLQQLKNAAAAELESKKKNADSKSEAIETAGQKLMQAAEERYDGWI
ncbi:hypothetical protein PF004_g27099 [Phytophthora fragariae]|uniref:Uncharacterized protein n=1 Tax=Phytophthora fragariae TaxID=53985 RepID=A0A6G0MMN3_9STRA|nr:hypothetical protein PF004_g27099 [Phytophthora fragariae]